MTKVHLDFSSNQKNERVVKMLINNQVVIPETRLHKHGSSQQRIHTQKIVELILQSHASGSFSGILHKYIHMQQNIIQDSYCHLRKIIQPSNHLFSHLSLELNYDILNFLTFPSKTNQMLKSKKYS